METVLDYNDFLVYMYNMHPDKQASTFGTNCVYYNQIFMVLIKLLSMQIQLLC